MTALHNFYTARVGNMSVMRVLGQARADVGLQGEPRHQAIGADGSGPPAEAKFPPS